MMHVHYTLLASVRRDIFPPNFDPQRMGIKRPARVLMVLDGMPIVMLPDSDAEFIAFNN